MQTEQNDGAALADELEAYLDRNAMAGLPSGIELMRQAIDALRAQPKEPSEAMVEAAAQAAYRVCAETRHVTLGVKCEEAVRKALSAAPRNDEAVELLQQSMLFVGEASIHHKIINGTDAGELHARIAQFLEGEL
ncbi:MAG: hypothetical protein CMN74_12250 [Sphingorhabdus sp.]|nr:hypothetical protein [Sphingorhabdus sp.]|tara:strand:+ start:257 stop:661 length:405 start_codon:yes stop_codon:yes gene_type:complete